MLLLCLLSVTWFGLRCVILCIIISGMETSSTVRMERIVFALLIATNTCCCKEWKWKSGDDTCNFFCVNMVPVAEEKTWEDALDHCREKNTDLLSLLSFTESQMAQGEIQSSAYTEPVWIGLRYLGNSWMWVNGDPMPYEAWPEGDQDHMCPIIFDLVSSTNILVRLK
uniref:C-type lectin domain-containing protein n=1 Tax=Poecilia reticulata TaxID=8081 RepID=A0A3P9PZL0_POERE